MFDEWLEQRQQQSGTSFNTYDSSHAKGVLYLRCHRAGKYVRKTETQATHTKKAVLHCPCFLNVKKEESGSVMVKGCLGHIGHDIDVALLRLTRGQQYFLKGLLEEYSHEYIINYLRREYSAKESRLYYVTMGDLWSLAKRFGLRPGFRHSDDMQSLRARKEEQNPNDGIRRLELPVDPTGKGFCMIIITPQQVQWLKDFSGRGISIDDTHNATRYNFKLATIMVLNERDAGVPAAFLLSGTMNSTDVEKLFLEVKKLFPDFNPAQIVTDEAPCFYNGFRMVFPQSRAKLHYCRWHIERTWQRNANKFVEPQLRGRLRKMLRDLLLVRDLPKFQRQFGEVLAFLKTEGQYHMEEYLRRNYLDRTPTWASFANQNAVMDTTMVSERWHLRLKTEFLHRNANARADCLVDLLIRAVEEMSQSDEIKVSRRLAQRSYRIQQTTVCHRLALKLFQAHPEKVRQMSSEEWEVERKPFGEPPVRVQRLGNCECPDVADRNVHCPLCDICPYSFSCSCTDNRAGISCSHQHAVKFLYRPSNRGAGTLEPIAEAEEQNFENVSEPRATEPLKEIGAAQERREQREQLRNSINMKVSLLQTNVNALVNTDKDDALEKLVAIHTLIEEASKIHLEPLHGIAVRPEVEKSRGKSKQPKVELYTRKQSRTAKKSH
ncbi:hypothetical protein V3C99_007794 [Haemonchus contortus]